MKTLIITVAGMATRFSQSVGNECVKCLYYENDFEKSILYRLLKSNYEFCDNVILVGGFRYGELQKAVAEKMSGFDKDIILIKNTHFSDYGSGYSLLLGLQKAFELGADEIVFAEGDLYVRPETFEKVWSAFGDVLTANCEAIFASKAVAFYSDVNGFIHYIFDSNHGALEIKEPFTSIRNSAQIWKFKDTVKLNHICSSLSETEQQGTNLVIIQKYFENRTADDYELLTVRDWINCNTVEDYRNIRKMEER
ncbi:MAG: DUF6564 domain-containing protein [Huintestinicola sp.]|uniref:DUF6564 domain-containing protein n=1 Tax=Huintestinicola sp. TaxID=2981661 RepID=UPI003F0FF1D4